MRAVASACAGAAALLLAGCTGVAVDVRAEPELERLRAVGYRIAVMPFQNHAPDEGFLSSTLAPVGELIALEGGGSATMRDRIGPMLHDDVIAWLAQSEFEVMDPWTAATLLTHAGRSAAEQQDPARAVELARELNVDGILYGDVQRWNRSYYVLQSIVEVALHLELIDGGTGKRLFHTTRTESIGSGLTGGPTGYVSVATEPLAGLRGSHLLYLTRSVARHAVTDLNGGMLGTQPGPLTPRLSVVALAKDHMGPFRKGERVDVIAVGSPDCDVRFDVGRLRVDVPMRQTERHADARGERATYIGHYIVDAPDVADDLPLACTIQRGAARRTVTSRYRWDGTLALDGSLSP
ncbi:MAG TPA: GNA1162 family protein [Planctomycetota bacterium]|nr:GNA1162 family protein [Planctomycetota bacterium]